MKVSGDDLLFESSSIKEPKSIFKLSDNVISKVIDNNELFKTKNIASTEIISFESFDGTEIFGLLTKPHDFDPNKKYPS